MDISPKFGYHTEHNDDTSSTKSKPSSKKDIYQKTSS